MADSPRFFFSGSRPSSRPPSEASNATERPDSASGPRSLAREIDHIKTLVARAQNAPPPAHTTITAQVFRHPSSSTPVTTAYIIHELDQLKRRLKHEQQERQQQLAAARRASEAEAADPETESEAEPDDVLDEREEELERAREEVMIVKKNTELLLEAAELKVDGLTSEKERLEGSLNTYREQIGIAVTEKFSLQKQLSKVQQTTVKLSSDVERWDTALKEQDERLKQLEAEREQFETSYNEAKEQISKLETLKAEVENLPAASTERVAHLESENINFAEQLNTANVQQAANDKSLRDELRVMQEKLNTATETADQSQQSNLKLQTMLEAAEAAASRSRSAHEARDLELWAQIDEHKGSLEKALQDVAAHTKEFEEVRKIRDEQKARADGLLIKVEEYQIKLGATLYEHERAQKVHKEQLGELESTHQQAMREMKARHKSGLQDFEEALTKANDAHVLQLETTRNAAAAQQQRLGVEHAEVVERMKMHFAKQLSDLDAQHSEVVTNARNEHQAEIANLKLVHDEQVRSLDATIQATQQRVQEILASNGQKLEVLEAEHSAVMQTATNELQAVKGHLVESERNAKLTGEQSQKALAETVNENELLTNQLVTVKESSASQVKKLQGELRSVEDELRNSRSAIIDLEASARASGNTAATRLEEQDKIIAEMKTQLGELKERHDLRTSGLENRLTLLTAEIESRDAKLIEAEQSSSTALNEQASIHTRRLDDLTEQHKYDHERLQEDFDAMVKKTADEHTSAITALERKHKDELAAEVKNGNDRVQQLSAEFANESRKLHDEHSQVLASLQDTHRKAVADINNKSDHSQQKVLELETQVETLHASLETMETERNDLQTDHATTVARLSLEHEEKLRREIEQLRQEHERSLFGVNQQAESRLRELEASHNREKDGLLTEVREAVHRAEIGETTISQLKVQGAQEVEKLSQQHSATMLEIQMNTDKRHADELRTMKDDAEKRLNEAASAHAEELRTTKDDAENRLNAAVSAHAAELELLNMSHVEATSKLVSEHATSVDSIRNKMRKEADAETERHLQNLKDAHANEISDLAAKHASELISSKTQAQADRDAKLAKAAADWETQQSALKDEHVKKLSSTKTAHANEVARIELDATNNTAAVLEQSKQSHEDYVAKIRRDHVDEIERLRGQHEDAMSRIAAKLDETKKDHDVRLQRLTDDHAVELQRVDENHKSTMERQTTELDAKVLEMQDDHARKLDEFITKHEAEINEARANATKDRAHVLSEANADAESRLKSLADAHDIEMTKLRTNHETNLSIAKASAIEEKETALAAVSSDTDRVLRESAHKHQAEMHRMVREHEDALIKSKEEAEKVHRSSLNEFQKQQDEHQAQMLSKHKSECDRMQEELQTTADRHFTELKMAEEEKAVALMDLVIKHTSEREDDRAEVQKQLQEMRTSQENQLSITKTAHEEALMNLREDHGQAITAAEKRYDALEDVHRKNTEELQSQHEEAISELKEHHASALTLADVNNAASLRQVLDAHNDTDQRNADAITELREQLRQSQRDHETKTEDVTKKHDQYRAEMEASLQKAEEERKDLEDRLRALHDNHSDQHASLTADHEMQMSKAGEEHKRALWTVRQECDQLREQMTKLEEAHSCQRKDSVVQLEHVKNVHEETLRVLRDERDKLRELYVEAEKVHTTDRAGSAVELQSAIALHEATIQKAQEDRDKLEATHKTMLEDVRLRHNDEIDVLMQKIQTQAMEHQRSLASLEEVQEDALSRLKIELSKALTELQDTKDAAVNDRRKLEIAHEERTSKLETGWSRSAEEALKAHEADLQRVVNEAVQNVGSIRETHAKELAERDGISEARLVALREGHAKEIAEVRDYSTSQMQDAQKHVSDMNSKMDTASAEHKLTVDGLHREHREALDHQHAMHEKQVQEMKIRHESALQNAQDTIDREAAALATAQAKHEQLIGDLRVEHAHALAQLQSKHDAERDVATKAQADLLSARRETEIWQAKVDETEASHAGQVENMKAAHNAEMKVLEDKMAAENAALLAVQEEKIDQAQRERSTRVSELVERHNRELESHRSARDELQHRLQLEHESSVASLRAVNALSLQELRAESERKAVETDEQHRAALSAIKSDHDEQLRHLLQEHNVALADLQVKHDAIITSLNGNASIDIEQTRQEHSRTLAAAADHHMRTIRQMQDEHDLKSKTLVAEHDQRIEALRRSMAEATAQQQQKHDEALSSSRTEAAQKLDEMRQENAQALEIAQAEALEALTKAQEAHQERIATMGQNVERMQESHEQALALQRAECDARTLAQLDELRSAHSQSLQEAAATEAAKTAAVQAEHQQILSNTRTDFESRLMPANEEHRAETDRLQMAMETRLNEAVATNEQSLSERDKTWSAKLEELQARLHAPAAAGAPTNTDDGASTPLRESASLHSEAWNKAVLEGRAAAEQQHGAAVEAAVARARQQGEAEIRNLKKRHRDAVTQIRVNAQKQAATQLTDLEQTHKQELADVQAEARWLAERQLRESNDSHGAALLSLRAAHEAEMAALAVEGQSSMSSKQAAFDEEMTALKTRLDASLTGQAEAERSVAGLRQQLAHAERRVSGARFLAEQEVAALQQEKEDLTSQLEKVQASLHDLQRKRSSGATTPRGRGVRDELATMKLQLDSLEAERGAMRLTLQKRLDEKSELTRQNDFLVKELEALLAQRSRPRMPPSKKSDALVQTDAFISEPKVDAATFAPIKESRLRNLRPATPLSPGLRQAKDEIDMLWSSRAFDEHTHDSRSIVSGLGAVIAANESLFAQKVQEHVGELQTAKDVLTADYKTKIDTLALDKERLERTVTARQAAAFAQERKELVARYGADFDDQIEQTAVLTSLPVGPARALRNAEERLVKDYNLRLARRKAQIALKHAEEFQNLTRQHDRKMADLLNSQSGIEGNRSMDPVRLEEDFRTRKLQTVQPDDEGRPDAPNSLSTSTLGQRPATSAGNESSSDRLDRQSRSLSAHRTSNPRTSTSIPRSSSLSRGHSGRRRSPEPTPRVPRIPIAESLNPVTATTLPRHRYPTIPQRSLMRAKTPLDYLETQRSPSDASSNPLHHTPRTPRTPKTPTRTYGDATYDHLVEPISLGPRVQRTPERYPPSSRSSSKPGFLRRIRDRISSDDSRSVIGIPGEKFGRPGSMYRVSPTPGTMSENETSSTTTAIRDSTAAVPQHKVKRNRSKQLSSGMIYYSAPRGRPSGGDYINQDVQA